MQRFAFLRVLLVVLCCSIIFAGGAYAKGLPPAQAAGAGLFIAVASGTILAALFFIRRVGRATRKNSNIDDFA